MVSKKILVISLSIIFGSTMLFATGKIFPRIFDLVDNNGNEMIEEQEFTQYKKQEIKRIEKRMNTQFKEMDKNKDEKLSYQEIENYSYSFKNNKRNRGMMNGMNGSMMNGSMMNGMNGMNDGMFGKSLVRLFEFIDLNNNEMIEQKEFATFKKQEIKRFSSKLNEQFKGLDINKDKKISYEESKSSYGYCHK